MKKLVVYPDEVLYQRSQPVTEFGAALDPLVDDLTWVMRSLCWNGIGIAAIQCGTLLRLSILELNYQSKRKGKPMVLCNPVILDAEGQQDGDEGCLSFPGKFVKLRRPSLIRIRYQDRNGREQRQFFHNTWARCVAHEIDHMDGVLVIDRAKEQGRSYENLEVKKEEDLD